MSWRQYLAPIIAGSVLGLTVIGCGPREQLGSPGYVEGFIGGAAADEPRASLVARDILASGGTAGDAAVALAFTLAVTYPSSAGLAGGGSCVGFDPRQNRVDSIDFWPRRVGEFSAGDVAVPSFVRGMSALHARFGRLPWSQVLAPAENLARFGEIVSRALSADLSDAGAAAVRQPNVQAMFAAAADGKTEGMTLRQVDLAGVIGQVRARGGGEFYAGTLARRIVDGFVAAGGKLSLDELRRYAPTVAQAPGIRFGFNHISFTTNYNGSETHTLAQLLTDPRHVSQVADPHVFVEAVARMRVMGPSATMRDFNPGVASNLEALSRGANRVAAPPESTQSRRPGATSFVVADRQGSAVGCALTMNAPFGTGRIIQGTGMFMAPAVAEHGVDGAALLVHNPTTRSFVYLGAGTGGPAAPSALLYVVQWATNFETGLTRAMSSPRLHHTGFPAFVQVERGLDGDVLRALERRRHQLVQVPALGRVNAMYCARGLPNRGVGLCEVLADPRGNGLATSADR